MSAVVLLGPAKIGSDFGYTCRVRLWSQYLGLITASVSGDTLRSAVQQASLRARKALRRRLHKRHDGKRRLKHWHIRPDFEDYEARYR